MRRHSDALMVAERRRAQCDIDAAAARVRAAEAATEKHADLIRAMRTHAATFAEELPVSWGSARGACPVKPSDPEWSRVENRLRESLPTARVTALDAVRNAHMWRLYRGAHGVMVAKGTADAVNEMELWHGTGATDPAAICDGERGFDPTYSIGSIGGKSYGSGCYFAKHAIYAHWRRAHPSRDAAGPKTLLLARVLVGDAKDFGASVCKRGEELMNEPCKADGTLYDRRVLSRLPLQILRDSCSQFDSLLAPPNVLFIV